MIVLLTDFGTRDPYVGILKGQIRTLTKSVEILDLCHEISPFNIRHGAYMLEDSLPYFPQGSIFVAIVDPGVGSARTPIVIKLEGSFLIGPNNGLFGFAQDRCQGAWIIPERERMFHTFDGRDVFAPCAAELSCDLTLLDTMRAVSPESIEVLPEESALKVVYADRFGNLITNYSRKRLGDKKFQVFLEGKPLPFVRTYSELQFHEAGAYFGSSNRLEIAVNQGRACDLDICSLKLVFDQG